MKKEIKKISIEYSDETIKELSKNAACIEIGEGEDLTVELLNASGLDIARITYGLIVTTERMGCMDVLNYLMEGDTNMNISSTIFK